MEVLHSLYFCIRYGDESDIASDESQSGKLWLRGGKCSTPAIFAQAELMVKGQCKISSIESHSSAKINALPS